MRDTFWLFAFALIGIALFLLTTARNTTNAMGVAVQNAAQQAAWSGQRVYDDAMAGGSSSNNALSAVQQATASTLAADLDPLSSGLLVNPANTINGQAVQNNGSTIAFETTTLQNNVVMVNVVGAMSIPWLTTYAHQTFDPQVTSSPPSFSVVAGGTTP